VAAVAGLGAFVFFYVAFLAEIVVAFGYREYIFFRILRENPV